MTGGQRLPRSKGRRQRGVKGAWQGLAWAKVRMHQEGAGTGPPMEASRVTGRQLEVRDGAHTRPPDHNVILEAARGPGLHHGVEIGVVIGGAGVIGGVVTRGDGGRVTIGVLGWGGGGAPGVGAQG